MNTRRTTARIVVDEIENVGETMQGNQVPPQVQAAANEQVLIDPPAMTGGEVSVVLFQMANTSPLKLKPLRHKIIGRFYLERNNTLVLWLAI